MKKYTLPLALALAVLGVAVAIVLFTANYPQLQAAAPKPAPGFVALPDDFHCSVESSTGFHYWTVGQDDPEEFKDFEATDVICWVSAGAKKPIALAKTSVDDGMLPTKEFGELQLTPLIANSKRVISGGVVIAVRSEKLRPLREYLQK